MEPRTLSKLAYYILVPAFIFNVFSKAEVQVELAVRMAALLDRSDIRRRRRGVCRRRGCWAPARS
jgi:hypothetical protein